MTFGGVKLGTLFRNLTQGPRIYDVFVTKKAGGCVCVITPYYAKNAFRGSVCDFAAGSKQYSSRVRFVREPERSCLIALYLLPDALRHEQYVTVTVRRGRAVLHSGTLENRADKAPVTFLSVTTLIKYEGEYLAEWIEHHSQEGVEHFYIYDNNEPGEGNVKKAIAPYVDRNIATYISWPYPYHLYPYLMKPFWPLDSHMYTQVPQMHHALYKYANETQWLLMSDVDEYIYSPAGETIPDVIRRYAKYPFLRIKGYFFSGSDTELADIPSKGVVGSFLYSESAPTSPTKQIAATLHPKADAMSVHEVIVNRERMKDVPENELVFNHYRAFGWRKATDSSLHRERKNDVLLMLGSKRRG